MVVDGAVLDVSSFAKGHPGGARLITNAIGTDVTSEILGEEASMGNGNMTFPPHDHTEVYAFWRNCPVLACLLQFLSGRVEAVPSMNSARQ